jgi:hypothetical protein
MNRLNLRDQAFLGSLSEPVGPYTPTTVPTDFPTNVRWYKASDFISQGYADTDDIDVDWIDNSIVGDDAPPDATDVPKWNTTEIVSPGSEGCVIITNVGGNQHFDFTELILGDFTIIMMWLPGPPPNQDTFLMGSSSGNYQVRNQAPTSTPASSPQWYPNAPPTVRTDTVGSDDPSVWHVQAWTRAGSAGTFYHNKQARVDVTNSNSTDMKVNAIGMPIAAASRFRVCDVQIYTSQLSQANIDDLFDNYFSKKYADDL